MAKWLSTRARPLAWRVLANRLHARRQQARGKCASQPGHSGRGSSANARSPITACAPGTARSSTRSRDHVEARGGAIEADQRPGQPCRANPAQPGRRRMRTPMRRTQTRDATALLIHHQQRAHRQDPAQVSDQRGKLRRGLNVAREQNDTARRVGAKHRSLVGCQRQSANPNDGGLQKSATEQFNPLARSRSQKDVACAVSEKPPNAHPPQRVAVVVDLAEGGLMRTKQIRHALGQTIPLRPRSVLGMHGGELHECAARSRRRYRMLLGRDCGLCGDRLGRCGRHSRHWRGSRARCCNRCWRSCDWRRGWLGKHLLRRRYLGWRCQLANLRFAAA